MKAYLLKKVRSTDEVGDEVPGDLSAQYVRAGLAKFRDEDDMKALRAEYRAKVGRQAYNGWDAKTLKAKMAEAE